MHLFGSNKNLIPITKYLVDCVLTKYLDPCTKFGFDNHIVFSMCTSYLRDKILRSSCLYGSADSNRAAAKMLSNSTLVTIVISISVPARHAAHAINDAATDAVVRRNTLIKRRADISLHSRAIPSCVTARDGGRPPGKFYSRRRCALPCYSR